MPTHQNPRYQDRTAVAPYNFVPLPEAVRTIDEAPAGHDIFDGLSGWFDCTLTTSSPLYVRGMITEKAYADGSDAKNQSAFFNIGAGPAIPGSSLRGLFRTLVEVASASRMRWVTNEPQVFRSVDVTGHGRYYRERIMEETGRNQFVPRVRAGYMRERNGEWRIQPAQIINETTFARIRIDEIPDGLANIAGCRNASIVFAAPGPYKYQDVRGGFIKIKYAKIQRVSARRSEGLHECSLVISGPMQSKRTEAVIFPRDPAYEAFDNCIEVPAEMARLYRDTLSDEQRRLLGNAGVLTDGQPVFYLVDEQDPKALIFFGHTMLMRVPYRRSPHDLAQVPAQSENLDLAEALFGFVAGTRQKGEQALAGRLSFTDARWVEHQGSPFEREITPRVLSGPKPTTFQHYLEQPTPDDRLRLKNYDQAARIRGHKFYWHQGAVKVDQVEEHDAGKLKHASQYTKITPVKIGESFTFRVRFDNLNPAELGVLVWLLDLASQPAYRLKLGMAKPLGLGAIAIKSELKLLNRKTRYAALLDKTGAFATGEQSPEAVQAARAASLEQFAAYALGPSQTDPARLAQSPRLQHLLKLLSWPGPRERDLTRYMEIERPDRNARRGKRNEYRERPVLPDALSVETPPVAGRAPEPRPFEEASEAGAAEQPTPQPPQERKPAPPETVESSAAQQKQVGEIQAWLAAAPVSSEPKPGDLIRAKVMDIDTKARVTWCEVETDGDWEDRTVLASVSWEGQKAWVIPVGKRLALRVIKILRATADEVELACEIT